MIRQFAIFSINQLHVWQEVANISIEMGCSESRAETDLSYEWLNCVPALKCKIQNLTV